MSPTRTSGPRAPLVTLNVWLIQVAYEPHSHVGTQGPSYLLDVAVEGACPEDFAELPRELVAVVLRVRKYDGASRAAVRPNEFDHELRDICPHARENQVANLRGGRVCQI